MRTILIVQEVDDVDHWLSSPKRHELFGPLGITARTFVDPERSNRVGLLVEVPSMEAFDESMARPGAAQAMKDDGVRPGTLVLLTER
jgi:hypothetical protein